MFTDEEKKLFVKYSMENEEQLKLSINISNSFWHLRKEIIKEKFIEPLEKSIKESFPEEEWEYANTMKDKNKNYSFSQWSGFYFSKKNWNKNIRIAFELQSKNATNPIIGVTGDDEFKIECLYKKMITEYKNGKSSSNWNYYTEIEGYQNWFSEDVLIKMYNGEAAKYFVKELKTIKDIVVNIIDDNIK